MPKKLFILDLDNTLIYGSYAQKETAKLLFTYSEYLKVYVRKFSKELIRYYSIYNCKKRLCRENMY